MCGVRETMRDQHGHFAPPPPPQSEFTGAAFMFPRSPVKGYFSRNKVRLVIQNKISVYTPDLGGAFKGSEHAYAYPK